MFRVPAAEPTDRPSKLRFAPAFAVVCYAAWSFATAGVPGLMNPDEGRYVEVAREMIATGDYLVPHFDGVEHWTKPPGAYWLIAASLRTFGAHAFAARLPSVLSGCIAALVVALIARRRDGPVGAALAVAVFATMLEPFAIFRTATADAPQAACIAVALGAWMFAEDADRAPSVHGRRRAFLLRALSALALGVSFLIKGPIALLVFIAARFTTWAVAGFPRPDRAALKRGAARAFGVFAVVATIGLPWFLAVVARNPELFDFFVRHEVADRYFSDVHRRTQPWWFFVPVVIAGLLPWTPLVLAEVWRALRGGSPPSGEARPSDAARSTRNLVGWFVGTFVLFSIGRSKLVTYVLPLFPAAAVLAAGALRRADVPFAAAPGRASKLSLSGPALVGLTTAAILCVVAVRFATDKRPILVVASGVGLSAATCVVFVRRRGARPTAAAAATVACAMLSLTSAVVVLRAEDAELGTHGSHGWIADVMAREEVVPRGTTFTFGNSLDEPAPPPANLALVGCGLHTLELSMLGFRPEWFPHLDIPVEPTEAAARGAVDDASPTAAFFARASTFGPAYAVTRGNLVESLRRAAGVPLVEIARRGRDRHAIVLLRRD